MIFRKQKRSSCKIRQMNARFWWGLARAFQIGIVESCSLKDGEIMKI